MKVEIPVWGDGNFHQMLKDVLELRHVRRIDIFAKWEWEVDSAWNTFDYYKNLEKFAKQYELNIYLGGWESDLVKSNTLFVQNGNVFWDPKFWVRFTKEQLDLYNCHVEIMPCKKLYLLLNNKPHPHRGKLMDYLAKEDLLQYGNISWYGLSNNLSDGFWPKYNYNFKYWKPETLVLDKGYRKTLNSYAQLPKQFSTTFMSLIAESTMTAHFLTEKTYMPIFFKKPFLIWGPKGVNKMLSTLGFQLYDKIFDYMFDSIENEDTRCIALLEQLHKIKHKNYDKMRNSVKHVIDHNYENALRICEQQQSNVVF